MKYGPSVALACSLAVILLAPRAEAQGIDKIRDGVSKIGISNKITVIFKNGREHYGALSDIGTDTFEIVEIDQRRKMTIRYDEVRKVRANYGGKGFGGKRPNPLWGIIAGIALVGWLIALVVASGGGS